MCGFGESRRIFRRREGSLAYDAFRVRSAIAWFGSRLLHGVEDLLGETLFIRSRRRSEHTTRLPPATRQRPRAVESP